MTETTRPSGVNVGVNNPGAIVYVKGNETTEESIRFILNPGDEEITLEQRLIGVWNPTKFRVSANTLFLDRQLSISSVGTNLQINAILDSTKSLVPDVDFDDDGSNTLKTPIVDNLIENFGIQTDFGTQIEGTSIFGPASVTISRIVKVLNIKTGTIAASADIIFRLTKGLTPGGEIVFSKTLPASQFSVSSDIEIDLTPGVGLLVGTDVSFNFISENTFSMLGDSSGAPFSTIDIQLLDFHDVVVENLVLNNALDIVLNNNLDPVYSNNF